MAAVAVASAVGTIAPATAQTYLKEPPEVLSETESRPKPNDNLPTANENRPTSNDNASPGTDRGRGAGVGGSTTDPGRTRRPQVAGVQFAVTGTDAAGLAVLGIGSIGLGAVLVRRGRRAGQPVTA